MPACIPLHLLLLFYTLFSPVLLACVCLCSLFIMVQQEHRFILLCSVYVVEMTVNTFLTLTLFLQNKTFCIKLL